MHGILTEPDANFVATMKQTQNSEEAKKISDDFSFGMMISFGWRLLNKQRGYWLGRLENKSIVLPWFERKALKFQESMIKKYHECDCILTCLMDAVEHYETKRVKANSKRAAQCLAL